MNYETPSDIAAKKLEQEKKFMAGLLGAFKDFVLDSMDDGLHDDFADHHAFIKACLETWQAILNSEEYLGL